MCWVTRKNYNILIFDTASFKPNSKFTPRWSVYMLNLPIIFSLVTWLSDFKHLKEAYLSFIWTQLTLPNWYKGDILNLHTFELDNIFTQIWLFDQWKKIICKGNWAEFLMLKIQANINSIIPRKRKAKASLDASVCQEWKEEKKEWD